MANVTSNQKNKKAKSKFLDVLLKVLMWVGIIIVAALILVGLYQIIKFAFVAAVLFIAWLFQKRRW